MPGAHRDTDSRFCGATTIATDNKVYVNGLAWAIDGDPSTHGAGNLIQVYGAGNVYINGIKVICAVGDIADPDNALHPLPPTDPKDASGDVFVYSGGAGGGA